MKEVLSSFESTSVPAVANGDVTAASFPSDTIEARRVISCWPDRSGRDFSGRKDRSHEELLLESGTKRLFEKVSGE
jgi:hypothetical protein